MIRNGIDELNEWTKTHPDATEEEIMQEAMRIGRNTTKKLAEDFCKV